MSCEAHCCGIEKLFSEKHARKQLKRYHKKGAVYATKKLLELFPHDDLQDRSLLDIGGGVGVIQREMMKAGVATATGVDASAGYIRIAMEEAARQEHPTQFVHGDFTDVAENLEPHDIVTLDKVLCCYPNVDDLLSKSLAKSNRYIGLVFPRDNLAARFFMWFGNLMIRFVARGFRAYLHSPDMVHAAIAAQGFKRVGEDRTKEWHVWLYGK